MRLGMAKDILARPDIARQQNIAPERRAVEHVAAVALHAAAAVVEEHVAVVVAAATKSSSD